MHLLGQNPPQQPRVDFWSLHHLTDRLHTRIQLLVNSGKVRIRELNPEGPEKGPKPTAQSQSQTQSTLTRLQRSKTRGVAQEPARAACRDHQKSLEHKHWDGRDGIVGLSTWIVNDALVTKQKSVEWLLNMIDNIEAKAINDLIEEAAHEDKDQNSSSGDDEQEGVSESSLGYVSQGKKRVKIGGRASSSDDDILGLMSNQSIVQERRKILHHEQPQVKDLFENFPAPSGSRTLYRRCSAKKEQGIKDLSKCHENQLCTYERMSAQTDGVAALPQPLPAGGQGAQQSSIVNEEFANREFDSRNKIEREFIPPKRVDAPPANEQPAIPGAAREESLKRRNSRWVATEEALDKWHAQSLGIGIQDYLDKKKLHQRMSRGHGSDKPQTLLNQKQEKAKKQQPQAKTQSSSSLTDHRIQNQLSLEETNKSDSTDQNTRPVQAKTEKILEKKKSFVRECCDENEKKRIDFKIQPNSRMNSNHLAKTQNHVNREKLLQYQKEQLQQLLARRLKEDAGRQKKFKMKNEKQEKEEQGAEGGAGPNANVQKQSSVVYQNEPAPKVNPESTFSFHNLLKQAQDKHDPNRTKVPTDPKKLNKITYSQFEQPKSQVIVMATNKDRAKYTQKHLTKHSGTRVAQGPAQTPNQPITTKKLSASSTSNKLKRTSVYTVERNHLIKELGGFHSKSIEDLYELSCKPSLPNKLSQSLNQKSNSIDPRNQRRLVCKSDLKLYNAQKAQIEKLLEENADVNAKAEAQRKKEMLLRMNERRQYIREECDKQRNLYLTPEQQAHVKNQDLRAQRVRSAVTKGPNMARKKPQYDPQAFKSAQQLKHQIQVRKVPLKGTEQKSRNEVLQPYASAFAVPATEYLRHAELYQSMLHFRREHESLRKKSRILLHQFAKKQSRTDTVNLTTKPASSQRNTNDMTNAPGMVYSDKLLKSPEPDDMNELSVAQSYGQGERSYKNRNFGTPEEGPHFNIRLQSGVDRRRSEVLTSYHDLRPRSVAFRPAPPRSINASASVTRIKELQDHQIDPEEIEAAIENHLAPSRVAHNKNEEISSTNFVNSEEMFYGLNRAIKGASVTSQSQKKLLKTTQVDCFNAQKSQAISQILDRVKDGNKQRQRGDILRTETQQQDGQNGVPQLGTQQKFAEGKLVGKSEAVKKAAVRAEIMEDHELDIIESDQPKETEAEKNKLALKSIDIAPNDQTRKKKFDFNDANFWYMKGYNHAHAQGDELMSAVDSYRQAISINPFHIESMHNLACVYEAQQRYPQAIKWFQLALELKPANQSLMNAYYGIALSHFKSGDPLSALPALSTAISQLDEAMLLEMEECRRQNIDFKKKKWYAFFYFRYLRALCHRVLKNYEESERDYVNIIEAFKEQEGQQICRNIFAMIIIPFEENRRRILRLVDQFQGILDKYEVERDRRILQQHFQEGQEPRWRENKRNHVQNVLIRLSFFKKFSAKRIREMMDQMTIRVVKAGNLLFFEKSKVYVIIGGSILMQNHWQTTDLPATHAKFRNGAILNFLQDGSEIFNSLETWFLAQVSTEIAVFDHDYFKTVWEEDIMTEQLKLRRALVRTYEVFKHFSDLALITLVSELMEIRTFEKGDLIIPQSAVAPSSSAHQEFVRSHLLICAEKKRQAKLAVKNKKTSQAPTSVLKSHTAGTHSKRARDDPSFTSRVGIIEEPTGTEESPAKSDVSQLGRPKHERTGSGNEVESTKSDGPHGKGTSRSILKPSSLVQNALRQGWLEDIMKIEEAEKPTLVSDLGGFYVITKGLCKVVHLEDGYEAARLRGGECFGESDLLQLVGFDYFGDIVAESDVVECIYISSKNFGKIPLFEQNNIRDYATQRKAIKYLIYEYCERYSLEYSSYVLA